MGPLKRLINYVFEIAGNLVKIKSLLEAMLYILEEVKHVIKSNTELQRPERMLTQKEAAAMLNITPRTLRNWNYSGKLVPVLIGGLKLYPESLIKKIKQISC